MKKIWCEDCGEEVKINGEGFCAEGHFVDVDEDILVSGFDPNVDADDWPHDEGYGSDWDDEGDDLYNNTVQEYE